jgi:threonine/homoserine/homoserine lactone efflux protein
MYAAKIFLMLVFVSIFTLISVAAKQKAWLSICGSIGGGMLLFMMVSMFKSSRKNAKIY